MNLPNQSDNLLDPANAPVGSVWRRIATGYSWTVENHNPNGTVTIRMRQRGDGYTEQETHDFVFFLGAFDQEHPRNPLAGVRIPGPDSRESRLVK